LVLFDGSFLLASFLLSYKGIVFTADEQGVLLLLERWRMAEYIPSSHFLKHVENPGQNVSGFTR